MATAKLQIFQKTTQKSQQANESTGQQACERVGVGLSSFRNFGLVECWIGAVVGKKIVGVVGLLYLCGLIGEMCAQLFCISGMGAN